MNYIEEIYAQIATLEKEENPDVYYYKGLLLSFGTETRNDALSLEEVYKKGINCGSNLCKYGLAILYQRKGKINESQRLFKQGFDSVRGKAQNGDGECLRMLSSYYLKGYECVEKNIDIAFDLLYKSALTGNILAMYNVANCFFTGEGVDKDICKAEQWCLKCINKEYKKAYLLYDKLKSGE